MEENKNEIGFAKVRILRPHVPVSKFVNEEIDPKEFFQTGKGLYVSDSFKENIAAKAEITTGPIALDSFDLIKDSDDEMIEMALPEKHIFNESEVCAAITALVKTQPKGEDGLLVNTGYSNLFYTKDFVVRVYWYSFDGGWHVGTWDRDDRRWDAEGRVFSPATDR